MEKNKTRVLVNVNGDVLGIVSTALDEVLNVLKCMKKDKSPAHIYPRTLW